MAVDLLANIRAEIDARLSELRPLLAEHERLLSAEEALAAEGRAVSNPPLRATSTLRRARARRGARRGSAAGAIARAAPASESGEESPWGAARSTRKRERASFGAAGQAILAALEHGSHTVAELVVVTALPAPDIRHDLRPLLKRKAIVKTARDGKTAYALPVSAPAWA